MKRNLSRVDKVSIEFGKQVVKYLNKFGLIEADLAYLIKSNSNDIDDIITGSKSVGLKKAERIANVFGVKYYEFGNPNHDLPTISDLPNKTQEAIASRKTKGVSERNYEKKISENLDKIINETDLLHYPVKAENIRLKLPEEIRDTVNASRISDLLTKGGRKEIITVVGKEGNANLYQLKKFVKDGK